MNITNRSCFVFLFVIALVSTSLIHGINRSVLNKMAPERMRSGIIVITSDDPSYIVPPENWLLGKGWRDNGIGYAAYTQRSPGYGLVYLMFRYFTDAHTSLWCLFGFQVLLFSLSCGLVFYIGLFLGVGRRLSFVLALTVAVLPTFSGFLSYTLTEGITPSLVLIFIFCLLRPWKQFSLGLVCSSAILGLLLVVRPAMLIWVVGLAAHVCWFAPGSWHSKAKQLILALTIAMMPLAMWQWRNHTIAGTGLDLHPIYHTDQSGLYRPLHSAVWDFHKMWGQSGSDFHKSMDYLWQAALTSGDLSSAAHQVLTLLPREAKVHYNADTLLSVYTKYGEILKIQAPYFKMGVRFPLGETAPELMLRRTFLSMQRESAFRSPWHTLIKVPLLIYWKMGAHSNLSLYVFQAHFRGTFFVELLRYVSFSIHLLVFLIFPIGFFIPVYPRKYLSIAVPVILYLLYLAAIQRGLEERYTLPVLVPMFLCTAYFVRTVLNHIFIKPGI